VPLDNQVIVIQGNQADNSGPGNLFSLQGPVLAVDVEAGPRILNEHAGLDPPVPEGGSLQVITVQDNPDYI